MIIKDYRHIQKWHKIKFVSMKQITDKARETQS